MNILYVLYKDFSGIIDRKTIQIRKVTEGIRVHI